MADAPDIPAEMALLGFAGVRAYSAHPEASQHLLAQTLGFTSLVDGAGHRLREGRRQALYHYDLPPTEPPLQGAGTVSVLAWLSVLLQHRARHILYSPGFAPRRSR